MTDVDQTPSGVRADLNEHSRTGMGAHALQRAITDLHEYLGRKTAEDRHLRGTLKSMAGTFNHRQLALLENALKNPDASYTVTSHARSHAVASQTARTDLRGLEQRGLLSRIRSGRGYGWTPAEDLGGLLKRDIN